MLKNYFNISLRFLSKNKIFIAINTLGLSIAMAATFTISLYVINEFTFNDYNDKREYIYRVLNYYSKYDKTVAETPYVLSNTLKNEFPQIKESIKARNLREFKLKVNDEYLNVEHALSTDFQIFNIFSIKLLNSLHTQNLLEDRGSILMSTELSRRLFKEEYPIGKKVIGIVNSREYEFTITGLYEQLPPNSTLQADCIVNSSWSIDPINKAFNISNADNLWDKDFWETWILVDKSFDYQKFVSALPSFEKKYFSSKSENHYSLQKLSDVYLHSEKILNSGIKGNINRIKILIIIALLILIVATLNYIILSTAFSTKRLKEIGIRKAFGISDWLLKVQLLSESIILVTLSLPVSVLFMFLSFPITKKYFQSDLTIIASNIPLYIILYIILVVFIGIFSGYYTSSYLSKLNVINILNKQVIIGKKEQLIQSCLIIVQLVIFCFFVSSAFIINSQYKFSLNIDPNYNTKDLIIIDLGRDFSGYGPYLNKIKNNSNVISAAGAMLSIPTTNYGYDLVPHFQDRNRNIQVEGISTGFNYLSTLGIRFIEGRDFSEEYESNRNSVILNESAVKELGIENPIGKKIFDKTIIGIVEDFYLHSIHSPISPLQITFTEKMQKIVIHYYPNNLNNLLIFLRSEWLNLAPDRAFKYVTIEDELRSTYSSEKRFNSIILIFAILTLVIASLGLLGLSIYTSKLKVKEVGIRKVLGCSSTSVLYTFLRSAFFLSLIGMALSIPLTIHFMSKWLQGFSYRVSIQWTVFALTFTIALLMILGTIFYYAYKISNTNPSEALKYE